MHVMTFRVTLENGESEMHQVGVPSSPDIEPLELRIRAWQIAGMLFGYAVAIELVD